jgi:hypothetical protein
MLQYNITKGKEHTPEVNLIGSLKKTEDTNRPTLLGKEVKVKLSLF